QTIAVHDYATNCLPVPPPNLQSRLIASTLFTSAATSERTGWSLRPFPNGEARLVLPPSIIKAYCRKCSQQISAISSEILKLTATELLLDSESGTGLYTCSKTNKPKA